MSVISEVERMVDDAGMKERASDAQQCSGRGIPSAADLDAVAAEGEASEATGGDPGDETQPTTEPVKVTTLECAIHEINPDATEKCKEEAVMTLTITVWGRAVVDQVHLCQKHSDETGSGKILVIPKQVSRVVRAGGGLVIL